MGIKDLKSFCKNAIRPGKINEFRGQTIAVDVSSFLHRGLFLCAEKIVNKIDTDEYIQYVRTKAVETLLQNDCHIILVFDGQPLPAKKETHDIRREEREKSEKLYKFHSDQGNKKEAYKYLQRMVKITPEHVQNTIRALKNLNHVDILVAPYEADAQLAYLLKAGIADAVVTIDTDLMVFGCEKIIYDLQTSGDCQIYDKSKLPDCFHYAIRKKFDFSIFRRLCILCGCDYLKSGLPGIGFKKAEEIFIKAGAMDVNKLVRNINLYLPGSKSLKVPRGFLADFIRAERTFLHQIVFDPIDRVHKPLNPYPDSDDMNASQLNDSQVSTSSSLDDFSYAGEILSPSRALRLALGNIDLLQPSIKDPFILGDPQPWSIWHPNFKNFKDNMQKATKEKIANEQRCGAFQINSPTFDAENIRKRPLPVDRTPPIFDEDQNELVEKRSCLSVGSRTTLVSKTRTVVIKNGAIGLDTADKWLELYGPNSKDVEGYSANSKNANSSVYHSASEDDELVHSPIATHSTKPVDEKVFSPTILKQTSSPIGRSPVLRSPYFSKKTEISNKSAIETHWNPFRKSLNVSASTTTPYIETTTVDRSQDPIADENVSPTKQRPQFFESNEKCEPSEKKNNEPSSPGWLSARDPPAFIESFSYRPVGYRGAPPKLN